MLIKGFAETKLSYGSVFTKFLGSNNDYMLTVDKYKSKKKYVVNIAYKGASDMLHIGEFTSEKDEEALDKAVSITRELLNNLINSL